MAGKHPNEFCKRDLINRGWTPALIAEHLGDPHYTVTNPLFGGFAPMQLWRKDFVIAREDIPELIRRRLQRAANIEKRERQHRAKI